MPERVYVRDTMSPPTQVIQASHTLVAARQRMQGEMRVKSLIVVEGDRPVGMIRYPDISGEQASAQGTVADRMLTDIPTVREDQSLDELSGLMTQYDVDRLPVVDASGVLIGELPRTALTLTETHATEAVATRETLADSQAGRQTPAFDIHKDMEVIGVQGHKVGKVKEVLSDALTGALTHVVIHTGLLFGKDKSLPVDVIDRVSDDQVVLKIDKNEVNMLPDLQATE